MSQKKNMHVDTYVHREATSGTDGVAAASSIVQRKEGLVAAVSNYASLSCMCLGCV